MSRDCQMDTRESGGGIVGYNMEGHKIYNKGTGQFYYRSLGNM